VSDYFSDVFRLLIAAILTELVDKKEAHFFDYPKDGGSKLTRNVREKLRTNKAFINFHSYNN
jgi:hypothetical protein